jgi:hypothetical protein
MADEKASQGKAVKFKLDSTAPCKELSGNAVDDMSLSSHADEVDQSNSTSDHADENDKATRRSKRQEAARVRRLRFVVLLLLVVAGIVISVVTYFSTKGQETLDYTRSVSALWV